MKGNCENCARRETCRDVCGIIFGFCARDYLVRRFELQGTPILAGLCGPMFDGYDKDNNARIRYESSDLYEILSE